jgi:hypothetical protein
MRPLITLRKTSLTAGLGATLLLACGKDSGPGDQGEIVKHAGDGQTATVGTALSPYQVLVTDLNGAPKAGVTVSWRVVQGGGSVDPASVLTGGDGLAAAVATLGTTAGPQSVRASAGGYGGSPVSFLSTATPGPLATLVKAEGDQQSGPRSSALPLLPTVVARDQYGNPVAGVTVSWSTAPGSGAVSATTTVTGADGRCSVTWTLGTVTGAVSLTAATSGLPAITFTATATAVFEVLGGGNNVGERFTSDLWVADGYAYTGTWGFRSAQGNVVKIWQLSLAGAPVLRDSIVVPNTGTISDIQVSPDGKWLIFTAEGGGASGNPGVHAYELVSPGHPVFRAKVAGVNIHTGTLATIGGKLYAFAAKDPANCALQIYDLSAVASGSITLASATPIPDNYCIHDTFVRDGYAFVFAWNSGLYIFDVGNGSRGGSPTTPVQISQTPGFGGETHNGWWYWSPGGDKTYLFIGEEGPGTVGASSSGSIHVVDVSDFTAPVEVGSYTMPGAGTHNFWVDEQKQVLYAAYYNGGVVALDISGTLSGSLAAREIARIAPGGSGNTYVWGVMLYGGFLYASDMLSGLWQLGVP